MTAAVVTLAAACSSSSSSTSGSNASGNEAPIKIGVVTSMTGASASGFTPGTEQGVKARLGLVNAAGGVDGHKITYVMADDASSPAGAANAVRQLIEQDHVTEILDVSSWFFGGYSIAVQAGIPVFGVGLDGGPEWSNPQNKNLFDISGGQDYTLVPSVYGKIAKALGVTKAGSLGYSGSPSSEETVNAFVDSAQQSGISKGYTADIAFGSTNVGPVVLGIKNTGTDGFFTPTIPSTAFAIIGGLAQADVKMKMVLLPTGYGGDLLADKAAVAVANGTYFYSLMAPVETGNAAAKRLQAALHTYAGVPADGVPTFAEYQGWTEADALIAALEKAGPNATSSAIISSFRSDTTWDGGGLYPQPVNFGNLDDEAGATGPGGCVYVVQLKNSAFLPVPGLSPVCGAPVPGLKVSP
jgi:branched-chain amino acid transport system substrate-binding protein